MYDVIVIGAGVAGMTAAIYARRAGKSVCVFEKAAYGGQIVSALKVGNWPGEVSISGMELSKKIYHQMNNLGVEIRDEDAMSVEQGDEYLSVGNAKDEARKVWLVKTDEAEYSCGAIIVATGRRPRELSRKQADDVGKRPISYCATCDGALYKGKPVVVIGSGNTAKHEISYLEGLASKVYHIHHDDPIPKEAEAVFVAIGRVPETEFLNGIVSLDDDGYVVAGENCRTSADGVFVAGDCRTKDLRQLVTAAGDGAMAATEAIKYLNE